MSDDLIDFSRSKYWYDAEHIANCRSMGLPDCPPATEFMPDFRTIPAEPEYLAADGYLWRLAKYEENGRDLTKGVVIMPETAEIKAIAPDSRDEGLRLAIWYHVAALRRMDAAQREGVPLDGRIAQYLHGFEKPYSIGEVA